METQEFNEIGINRDVLREMAFTVAPEIMTNDDINLFVDDELYENMPYLDDLKSEVKNIEVHSGDSIEEYAVHFLGRTKSWESHRVSVGSRHHPPEYERRVVNLRFELIFRPAGGGGHGAAEFNVHFL